MLDRPLPFRTGIAVLLFTLVGLSGLIAYLLSESDLPSESPPGIIPAGTRPDKELAEYLGDQACRPCHPAVFETHSRSRHAATLHALESGRLPFPFPDHDRFTDASTGLQYRLERQGDQYLFQVQAPEGPQSAIAEFAFGSGKTGVTLVSRAEEGTARELRMSYFPGRKRWEVTPGQRGSGVDPLGTQHDRATSQRCFSCHATVVAASQLIPEPRFMGVGCESCHGPGRAHVEAVHRREADHRMARLGEASGEQINELCGHCHRTERELDPFDTFSRSQTQRFQPIGLARSACFRASSGRLTCVTCHDPHTDAVTTPAHYEATCLSCHAPTPEHPKTRPPDHLSKACPISPRAGCVSCHMPDREVVRGITMADHWIRVFPESVKQSQGSRETE